MLLLSAFAYAAPPVPQLGNGFAVGVAAFAGTGTDILVDPDCDEGGNCTAHRERGGYGGALLLQVTPVVGAWVGASTETVKVAQAGYGEAGVAFDGGVALNLRPKQDLGALVWLGGDYAASGDEAADHARRWGVRGGGAARFGRPDAQGGGWVGAELRIPGADLTAVLDGALEVELAPVVPASVVGGLCIWSPPLGGWGRDVPRAFLSVGGSLGAENGIRVTLGAGF